MPGNDVSVIVRRNHRKSLITSQGFGTSFPLTRDCSFKHDGCTEPPNTSGLRPSCIDRHDDGRWHAEQPRSKRNSLPVIARRMRDDATLPGALTEAPNHRIRTAKLEGAGSLKRLGFEPDLLVETKFLQPVRGEERRPDRNGVEANSRLDD